MRHFSLVHRISFKHCLMMLLNMRYSFSVPSFRSLAHISSSRHILPFLRDLITLSTSVIPILIFSIWMCVRLCTYICIQVFAPLIISCTGLFIIYWYYLLIIIVILPELTLFPFSLLLRFLCCVAYIMNSHNEFPLCSSSSSDTDIYLCAFPVPYPIFLGIYDSSDLLFLSWCNFVRLFLIFSSAISDKMPFFLFTILPLISLPVLPLKSPSRNNSLVSDVCWSRRWQRIGP